MALDTAQDDRIVGMRINELLIRQLDKNIKSSYSSASLKAFFEFIESQYDPWMNPDTHKVLKIRLLLVDPEYRGQNLSIRMMESTFDLMRQDKNPSCSGHCHWKIRSIRNGEIKL